MKSWPKNRRYWIVCGVLFAVAGIPFLLFLPLLALVFEVLALILILSSGRLASFYAELPASVVRPAASSLSPVADPDPADAPAFKWEHARVAGVTYHEDAIRALASPDYDFDDLKISDLEDGEKIFELYFPEGPVDLVPEPSNPHDKNAVKVLIAGQHVGYIKAGSCAHVLNLLRAGRILDIKADIRGGRWKANYDEQLERGTDFFSIKLSIKVAQ